jgi:hypothetical protein
MAKKKETRSKTGRTQVKDLTEQEKELTKEEQKRVKGGSLMIAMTAKRGGNFGDTPGVD